MNSWTTRVASAADLARIVEIYNQAVDDQCTADMDHVSVGERRLWFETHQTTNYPILVVEVQGMVVGWISLSPYRDGRRALRRVAEISYYVDRDKRGEGVGSRLLTAAIDAAKLVGMRHLFGILLEDNVRSIALLTKFGFTEWGSFPNVAEFDGRTVGQVYYGLSFNE